LEQQTVLSDIGHFEGRLDISSEVFNRLTAYLMLFSEQLIVFDIHYLFTRIISEDIFNKRTNQSPLQADQILLNNFNMQQKQQSGIRCNLLIVDAIACNLIIKYAVGDVDVSVGKITSE